MTEYPEECATEYAGGVPEGSEHDRSQPAKENDPPAVHDALAVWLDEVRLCPLAHESLPSVVTVVPSALSANVYIVRAAPPDLEVHAGSQPVSVNSPPEQMQRAVALCYM